MQTKLYIQDLKNIIDGETYSSIYSFFSNYEETTGKPKNDLIYLNYSNFDEVIVCFFDSLFDYLKNTGYYPNIQTHADFERCVEDFFIATAISSGNLGQLIKNKYHNINIGHL